VAAATAPAPAAAGGREELARVLGRREFAGIGGQRPDALRPAAADWLRAWWQRLADWLGRQLSDEETRARPPSPSLGARPLALVLIVLVVALAVAVALGRWERERATAGLSLQAAGRARAAGTEALERSPDEWRAEAERLLDAGDPGRAVRALFLCLLVTLHRSGAIEVRPSATNWEHGRRLARRWPDAGQAFTGLVELFDRVVYGRREAAVADFERARRLGDEVLARCQTAGAGPAVS
jgi:hypothetical protein